MSRETIVNTAAALPRAPLFGIGACRVGTEVVDFEIGWGEYERDVQWATSVLAASGVKAGDRALTTMPGWEAPWSSPVIAGLRELGAVYLPAEQFAWDARRVAHLIESMKPRIFIGLCAETLDGLHALECDAGELLSGVELIWARHDALAKLAEIGITAMPFVPVGPALAMGTSGGDTVVNTAEWTIGIADGEFVVTTRGDRVHTFTDTRTGIKGRLGPETPHGTTISLEI